MAPKALQMQREESHEEVKPVMFYAWIEHQPSNLVIRVSGGELFKDGNGKAIIAPTKNVHFRQGILCTEDPEAIELLDRLIKKGETITRSYELFLKNTMPAESYVERTYKEGVEKDSVIRSQDEEIKRLKALVEAQK